MENYSEINRYILNKTIEGSIEKEYALKILKAISNNTIRNKEDFAIIGMECRAANNDSKEELWNSIINRRTGVRKMPKQRIDQVKSVLRLPESSESANVGYLNRIDEFDPSFFRISNHEAKMMDPKQRMFLEVFYNALEDAGYSAEELAGRKIGIFVGADHSSDMQMSYKMMMRENDMLGEVGTVSGIIARRPAYLFNYKGPAMVIDTSCSSSLVAIHTACQYMSNGDCEMAIIGGINMVFYTTNEGKFSDIESESVFIRSFDKYANGTNWGEGVAAIVIKPLETAKKDHDNILAIIKGTSINNDGMSNGIVSPNPEAQEELIRQTLSKANVDPSTISYVECHGTGTVIGDQIEIRSLANAYSYYCKKKQFCGIGSIKPNIGHLVGASALVGIIKIIMSMKKRVIPPSINFETPNPFIRFMESPFYVVDKITTWGEPEKPVRAAINSFGFSGTNTHAILESPPQRENESMIDDYELLTVSSMHKKLMPKFLERYIYFLSENDDVNFADFCYTANKGRRDGRNRLAFLVKSKEDAIAQMQEAKDKLVAGRYCFTQQIDNIQSGTKKMRGVVEQFLDSERINKAALNEIAELYEQGVDVNWNQFYKGCHRYRISIPVSLFQNQSFWIDPDEKLMVKQVREISLDNQKDVANGIYRPGWIISDKKRGIKKRCKYLVIGDGDSFSEIIEEKLKEQGMPVYSIARTNKNSSSHVININDEKSYETALKDISSLGNDEFQVIYLWGMKDTDPIECYKNFARLIKSLIISISKATIKVVTDRVFCITGEDANLAGNYQSMLLGLCRTVEREIATIECDCVDIDKDSITHEAESMQLLIDKLCVSGEHGFFGIRNGIFFTESYIKLTTPNKWKDNAQFKEEGTYLITGGCGTLGSLIADYLINQYRAKVVLLVRHDYGDLKSWLKVHKESEKEYASIRRLCNLLNQGANLEIICADITNAGSIQVTIDEVEKKYGKINGVFHLAGVKGGKLIQAQQLNANDDVFEGKVRGLMALHKVLLNKKIDFMILFSSMLNYFGAPGQSSYISANMYLDGYAEKAAILYPERLTISINWDNFIDIGMAANIEPNGVQQNFLTYGFIDGLMSADCMKAICIILQHRRPHVYVSLKNLDRIKDYISENGKISDIKVTPKLINSYSERPELAVEYIEPRNETEAFFARVWAELLEIERVGINDNFFDLGGDSIFAIKFVSAVKDKYQIEVSDVFRCGTVEALANYAISIQNGTGLKDKFEKTKAALKNLAFPAKLVPKEKEKEEKYLRSLKELDLIDFSQKKDFRNILLLGSTGFLGTYLAREILTNTSVNITVIVRSFEMNPIDRQKKILNEYFGMDFFDKYSSRIFVLSGEVCKKNFGLTSEEYNKLCSDIDCIVNSVGKVDHYGKYEDFYEANVAPVKNIIDFAKTGRQKEIHHISTKGVAMGNIQGCREVVFTEEDIDFGQVIPNYYAESKNAAEKLLVKARSQGICVNIYRTSEIIGDSVTGKFQKNIEKNAVYLEVRAMMKFERTVSAGLGLWELSFVDIVSSFLVALMLSKGANNMNYHLYSHERISINDWNKAFAEIGIKKEEVSIDEFLDYLYENMENPEQKEYIDDFLLHTNVLEMPYSTQYRIMTNRTELVLSKLGLKWEKPTTKQLVKLLQYGSAVGFFQYE